MLNYEIFGSPAYAEVIVTLGAGEQIVAEGGAMSYMDGTIEMSTASRGGIGKGIKRMFSGESFFQNTFTGPGKIALASGLPGDIIPIDIIPEDGGWIFTKDAFVGGTTNIEISSKWGGFRSMFGGEGAFLTHIKTKDEMKGMIFAGGFGAIRKHEVAAGETFAVDNGIFFATPDKTEFKTSKVGGKKSFLFGGEGLVMRFVGPCTVYTQSRAQGDFITLFKGMMKA